MSIATRGPKTRSTNIITLSYYSVMLRYGQSYEELERSKQLYSNTLEKHAPNQKVLKTSLCPKAYKILRARILRTTMNTSCYMCSSNIKFRRWPKRILTPWRRHCKVSTSRSEHFFWKMAKAKYPEHTQYNTKYSNAKVNTVLGDWANFNYSEGDEDKRACHVGMWVFIVCENAE